ncbi:MAG: PilZ domain-containing protein, partial [Sphingopyxis sp.]
DEVIELLAEGGGRAVACVFKSAREPRMRTFRRIQVASGGYRYEAIVRNMSSRGALIEGLWNVPDGTPLTLELAPDLRVDAEARWSTGNRVGVRFAEAIDMTQLSGPPAQPRAFRQRAYRAA